MEKAGEPYSTRVIGVYATQPGVLLTERGVDERLEDLVPVGVIGVIPTKVSAENGPIRRGDLLVSARTPGSAMRADPERLRFGMVLGKALGGFTGPGRAVIPVLVNVKISAARVPLGAVSIMVPQVPVLAAAGWR